MSVDASSVRGSVVRSAFSVSSVEITAFVVVIDSVSFDAGMVVSKPLSDGVEAVHPVSRSSTMSPAAVF